jgi:hypothetical protein
LLNEIISESTEPQCGQSVVFIRNFSKSSALSAAEFSLVLQRSDLSHLVAGYGRRALSSTLLALGVSVGMLSVAAAQTLEVRQWQGQNAAARQPEQVLAQTQAEWRSLWMRVGTPAPDMFETGRMRAVGIFLGPRTEGHGVNLISTNRRRDRIVVVFEERSPPAEALALQRPAPASSAPSSRAVSSAPMGPAAGSTFANNNVAPPPAPAPPAGLALRGPSNGPTSPWAIILINRTDLPISVEQRLFR